MKGIIILDGADGAGKTTLANELCRKVPSSHYMHLGKPNKGHAWDEHLEALLTAIKLYRQGQLVVLDRHFISEAFYGQVYRNGSEYPHTARHIDRLLYRFGALRVICAPPINYVTETHAKLSKEREELYHDKMEHVADLYLDLWRGNSNPDYLLWSSSTTMGYLAQLISGGGVSDKLGWAHYDVSIEGVNLDKKVDALLEELEGLQKALPIFYEDADNLTGWPRKQAVLLVGDKSSSKQEWPFLANQGSSLYLAQTLAELHVDEARVCMINANGRLGTEILRHAKVACGRVIALGKEAERRLEQARIPYHARVRHPQHAARFSRSDSSYLSELRHAFNGMAGAK